uniref:Uncharacterized protein n=1 Tax=Panagrolaimus sp. PS1159 TaxID=55785 RepID=A0AC35G460_9BILA
MAPTLRPRTRRPDSTSSSSSEIEEKSAPVVRKNTCIEQREDDRGSAKERQRKSQFARILPRRPNRKFARISESITPQSRSSSRPPFQKQSNPEESFSDTTGPKLPSGRNIKDLLQTPEGQKRFHRSIAKSVEKALVEKLGEGTRLNSDSENDTEERKQLMKALNVIRGILHNFDSDDDEHDRNKNPTPPRQRRSSAQTPFQQQSNPEESFSDTTGPKLPAGRNIKDMVQTPEGQKRLQRSIVKALAEKLGEGTRLNFDSKNDTEESDRKRKELMKTLNEIRGSLLSFDSDSESDTYVFFV